MCRKKRTRVVVNTSSVDGSIGTNRSGHYGEQAGMQLAYSSSKAALNMRAPRVFKMPAFSGVVHLVYCYGMAVDTETVLGSPPHCSSNLMRDASAQPPLLFACAQDLSRRMLESPHNLRWKARRSLPAGA